MSTLYYNGKIVDNMTEINLPYVYQFVRTSGYAPLYLPAHLGILSNCAKTNFGIDRILDEKEISDAIVKILYTNRYPNNRQNIVLIRLYSNEDITIIPFETSYYDNFTLRAIHPTAICYNESINIGTGHNSLFYNTTLLARSIAQKQEIGVVIFVGENDTIKNIDGANPIAVYPTKIIIDDSMVSVEIIILIDAVKKYGRREIIFRHLTMEDIYQASEIWYVDYRGITTLSSYGHYTYTDIVANIVAQYL